MFESQHSYHPLKDPLHSAIGETLQNDPTLTDKLTETVLRTLDERGVIQYAPPGTLALLSATGRVFVCIANNPNLTIREIAMMLGITESNVNRSVSRLVDAGVIARTKLKGRNVYTIDTEKAQNHPDIQKFYQAVGILFQNVFLDIG